MPKNRKNMGLVIRDFCIRKKSVITQELSNSRNLDEKSDFLKLRDKDYQTKTLEKYHQNVTPLYQQMLLELDQNKLLEFNRNCVR